MDLTKRAAEQMYDMVKSNHIWMAQLGFGAAGVRHAFYEVLKKNREELPTLLGIHRELDGLIERVLSSERK